MKINRKTVLSTAAVLGVAALIAGGTIAYFTDSENKVNNFTVGNVDIELYESQLHRVNANMATSGREGTLTSVALASDPHVCGFTNTTDVKTPNSYCTPNITAYNSATDIVSAWDNGHIRRAFTAVAGLTGAGQSGVFSDQQIIDDSTSTAVATVDDYGGYPDYIADEYNNLVPGKSARKFVYVKNADATTPAYARIKVTIPASVANKVTVKIPSTPFKPSTGDGNKNVNDQIVDYAYFDLDATTQAYFDYVEAHKSTSGMTVTGDVVLTFVVHDALEGKEMTYWSPINTVTINKDANVADFANLANKQFGITVDAEAIQAGGFATAAEAFAAYGARN